MDYPMGDLIGKPLGKSLGKPMGDYMAHEWPARWDGMGWDSERSHGRGSTESWPISSDYKAAQNHVAKQEGQSHEVTSQ